MTSPSYDECLVEAELRARSAYAQPDRHYHGLRHLDDCLQQLEGMVDLDERERRLLRWAILWHDAIYDPGRGDNEERSAELACSELLACGIEEADAKEVARLILLTKEHVAAAGDRRAALVVSIDLAILGENPSSYRAYIEAVRREYAHFSDEEWRVGRAAALRKLLERDPIYPDARFQIRYENRARRNLEGELNRLSAG